MNNEFWNAEFSQGRDYTPVNVIFLSRLLKFIQNNTSDNRLLNNALDVGCGTGDFAVKLSKEGIVATGIDISSVAIKKAYERAEHENISSKVNFLVADFETIDVSQIPGRPFDLIISKLSYVFINDRENFLRNVHKLLSPRGVFVLMTPVLYRRFVYDERVQNISVDFEDTKTILSKYFKNVGLFHENFFEEMGSEITFVIYN